jgi:hypothetical protein
MILFAPSPYLPVILPMILQREQRRLYAASWTLGVSGHATTVDRIRRCKLWR